MSTAGGQEKEPRAKPSARPGGKKKGKGPRSSNQKSPGDAAAAAEAPAARESGGPTSGLAKTTRLLARGAALRRAVLQHQLCGDLTRAVEAQRDLHEVLLEVAATAGLVGVSPLDAGAAQQQGALKDVVAPPCLRGARRFSPHHPGQSSII
jgi:hypothetical protein